MHLLEAVPFCALLASLFTLYPSFIHAQKTPSSLCATGVHIIAGAGHGDRPPHGYGELITLMRSVKNSIPGSTQHLIRYPEAPFVNKTSDPPTPEFLAFISAVGVGQTNFVNSLESYVESCPKSKIVVLAYSEGAMMASNALCGDTSAGFTPTTPVDSKYNANIIATVQYGDETRAPFQAYNFGTCPNTTAGIFTRTVPALCAPFSANFRSYCDIGDPLCCAPGDNSTTHATYPTVYDQAATQFVLSKYQASL